MENGNEAGGSETPARVPATPVAQQQQNEAAEQEQISLNTNSGKTPQLEGRERQEQMMQRMMQQQQEMIQRMTQLEAQNDQLKLARTAAEAAAAATAAEDKQPGGQPEERESKTHAGIQFTTTAASAAAAALANIATTDTTLQQATADIIAQAAETAGAGMTKSVDQWDAMGSELLNTTARVDERNYWKFPTELSEGVLAPVHADGRPTTTHPNGTLVADTTAIIRPTTAEKQQLTPWSKEKLRAIETKIAKEIVQPIIDNNDLKFKLKKAKPVGYEEQFRLPNQPGLPLPDQSVSIRSTLDAVAAGNGGIPFTEAQKNAANVHAHIEERLLAMERLMRFAYAENEEQYESLINAMAGWTITGQSEDDVTPETAHRTNRILRQHMIIQLTQLRVCITKEFMQLAGLASAQEKKQPQMAMQYAAWTEAQKQSKPSPLHAAVQASRSRKRPLGAGVSPALGNRSTPREQQTSTANQASKKQTGHHSSGNGGGSGSGGGGGSGRRGNETGGPPAPASGGSHQGSGVDPRRP